MANRVMTHYYNIDFYYLFLISNYLDTLLVGLNTMQLISH